MYIKQKQNTLYINASMLKAHSSFNNYIDTYKKFSENEMHL